MKKQVPNIITCCNLICGCFAILFAVKGLLPMASLMILAAAFFDFCDGFAARLLHAQSPIGKDMDSLADLCSFGIAPAMILLHWMESCLLNQPPAIRESFVHYSVYIAFLIPAFSAVRLAKFNHDDRQKSEFRGLATPANALFLGFLHFASDQLSVINNFWALLIICLLFSGLLIANIPMFSLKFHNLAVKDNIIRYVFLSIALLLFIFMHLGAFPVIILCYILISLCENLVQRIL